MQRLQLCDSHLDTAMGWTESTIPLNSQQRRLQLFNTEVHLPDVSQPLRGEAVEQPARVFLMFQRIPERAEAPNIPIHGLCADFEMSGHIRNSEPTTSREQLKITQQSLCLIPFFNLSSCHELIAADPPHKPGNAEPSARRSRGIVPH
jgi:hypothetical protein